jgi:hypothetical protein
VFVEAYGTPRRPFSKTGSGSRLDGAANTGE